MGMPKFVDLCPLIQVYDMLESVLFYSACLGFKVREQSPFETEPYNHFDWALLRRGDVQIMLNTAYDAAERPAARDAARIASHADTMLYFGCKNMKKAYRELRAHGVAVDEPKVVHGLVSMTFTDPDGYGICLQWPQ